MWKPNFLQVVFTAGSHQPWNSILLCCTTCSSLRGPPDIRLFRSDSPRGQTSREPTFLTTQDAAHICPKSNADSRSRFQGSRTLDELLTSKCQEFNLPCPWKVFRQVTACRHRRRPGEEYFAHTTKGTSTWQGCTREHIQVTKWNIAPTTCSPGCHHYNQYTYLYVTVVWIWWFYLRGVVNLVESPPADYSITQST